MTTAYKKHLFLLVYNNENKFLVLQRNKASKWEIPSLHLKENESIKDAVEKYFLDFIPLYDYKYKEATVINRYDLPKEFQSITGYFGEEQRFKFIRANSEVKNLPEGLSVNWMALEYLFSFLRIRNLENVRIQIEEEFQKINLEEEKLQAEHEKDFVSVNVNDILKK